MGNIGVNGNRAVFILSQLCNLACTYCYAHEARSKDVMKRQTVQKVVDYIFSNNNGEMKSFTFIGGGEPCATWELLKWSIEYIREKGVRQKVYIGLTTNATLLDQEKIQWLKINEVSIGCSFDILSEIQNRQRPFWSSGKKSFDVVDNSIRLLIKNGIIPGIRSTITEDCVTLMPQMVEFIHKQYPQIRRVHLEQVTDKNMNFEEYYPQFVEYYFAAKEIAIGYNILLKNSITRSVKQF